MKKKYTLGIDVGTTGTKTILFSEDGIPQKRAYSGYPLSTPCVGHSEQDAEEIWAAVVSTVREVCDGIDGEVVAISMSTQGGTLIPVSADGVPLCPAIVWNDTRCQREREAYEATLGGATMYEKTGWTIMDGLLAMQIRHIRDTDPALFEKTAMFLSVPDYISLKMTGRAAVDKSNLGINQLGNLRLGGYDKEILDFVGITEERLPEIVPSGAVIGRLTEAAAEALGLTTDTLLISGAHDQYAVALGAGAISDGDMLIGSGTCWVVTAIKDSPAFESGLSQSVSAVDGLYGSLFSLSSGGVCLEWLRKNIAVDATPDLIDYGTLDREAESRAAATEGLFFLPNSGIYGECGQTARAAFIGMDLSHDRFHLARAVMEGIAFQIRKITERFDITPSGDGLILAGGASRSALWAQIVADVTGLPVRIPAVADLACVGAGILAGTGAGLYADTEEAYSRFAVDERVINPDPDAAAAYGLAYKRYDRITAALCKEYDI